MLLEEGFEGTSIGKIAKHMDIHPSLIIHYFKTKENMTLELVELLIEKYLEPGFLQFNHITDLEQRFYALIDTIFSFEWSRTINPGLHFGFYYLSFRNPAIHERYKAMIKQFRDYLIGELELFRKKGILKINDVKKAADILNFVDGAVESKVIEQITEADEELSQQIQDSMFVFENLIDIDDRGMQTLLREVSSDQLLLALRGAPEGLRDKIFHNMSSRAAEMLKDDLEAAVAAARA